MRKRILAGLLAVAVAVGNLGGTSEVLAKEGTDYAGNALESSVYTENALSVNGTDSFGNLLMEELNETAQEQTVNNGYNIFSIEMNGTTAEVEFETVESASLVVGIYDESGKKMLASGSVEVTKEDTTASVSIDSGNVPQYFYIKGYLVDTDTLRPLCTVYECPNYTQQMQEFLGKTTADFDADRVLNLDEDTENNFAVYKESTKVLTASEETNSLVSSDEVNGIYIMVR